MSHLTIEELDQMREIAQSTRNDAALEKALYDAYELGRKAVYRELAEKQRAIQEYMKAQSVVRTIR